MKQDKLISFVLPLTHLSVISVGWGNGYVALPKNHPCFGKDYDSIAVNIHGGIDILQQFIKRTTKRNRGNVDCGV